MNYLAHLYLSDDSTDSIVGSLLGDFVKGALSDRYTLDIRLGIELHRKIDVFTDSHQMFRLSKSRIHTDRRRFAGVAVDIFYDHFLAANWSDYSTASLQDFSLRVYRALDDRRDILPERLKGSLPAMIKNNWLMAYRDLRAIRAILERTSRRLRRENPLADAIEDLTQNYDQLQSEFRNFFPDLIEFADAQKKHMRKESL
jgi:acyl carrier protein phosphodiesterase